MDVLGVFFVMAGFTIGLGAVTVIDLHGFLGRRSSYWTVATTRTHKVTKPLIWIGTALAVAGGLLVYRDGDVSGYASVHAVIAAALVLNGLFLTFRVSPFLLRRERDGKDGELLSTSWQRRIAASFVVSFVGWWAALALFAIHFARP